MTSLLSKSDVVSDLESRILSGELAPGEKLPAERNLSLRYAVSRPVIREALAGLVERGLVAIYAGRGSYVREMSIDDLSLPLSRMAARTRVSAHHLVDARLMIETAACRLAAERSDLGTDLDAIFAALHAHDEATTLSERAQTDLDFHEAIAAASGNPVITLMFGSIRAQVYSLMLRSHSDPQVRQAGDPFHRRIADSIQSGDAERAVTLMREHLELALNLYGDDLDRPLTDVLENRGISAAAALVSNQHSRSD